jgi:small subunit ribosomal protein S6
VKGYETIVIMHPDLSEEQVTGAIAAMSQLIADNGGTLTKAESWGLKRIAYRVKKQTRGHILYFLYAGNRKTVDELERTIRIDETAIRYMTVVVDKLEDAAQMKPQLLEDPVTGLAQQEY